MYQATKTAAPIFRDREQLPPTSVKPQPEPHREAELLAVESLLAYSPFACREGTGAVT